jgi:hypothetical protein
MAFDRKDYGMNSGIPFIKIADRGEVTVDLKGKRVSGPPLIFKQGPDKRFPILVCTLLFSSPMTNPR